jgi:hypothetical protein
MRIKNKDCVPGIRYCTASIRISIVNAGSTGRCRAAFCRSNAARLAPCRDRSFASSLVGAAGRNRAQARPR